MRLELAHVDSLDTAYVDRAGWRPIPPHSVGEGLDASRRAEHVVDDLMIECVALQILGPAQELEIWTRYECEHRARSPAHRAVADYDGFVQVELGRVLDFAAVAAALVGFYRHAFLLPGLPIPVMAALSAGESRGDFYH